MEDEIYPQGKIYPRIRTTGLHLAMCCTLGWCNLFIRLFLHLRNWLKGLFLWLITSKLVLFRYIYQKKWIKWEMYR